MNAIRQQVLEALAALREDRLSFEAFEREFNQLTNEGVLGSFQSVERRRLSEFIGYLDAYDPDAKPSQTAGERWKAESKRIKGERAYAKEEIIEAALALERCLMGDESRWQRLQRFFGVRQS